MLKYLIQTIQVGASGASDITFTNIPTSYDDLVIVTSLASTVDQAWCKVQFNGSDSNWSSRSIEGYGSSGGGSYNRADNLNFIAMRKTSYTSGSFGNSKVTILDFKSSNAKVATVENAVENLGGEGIITLTAKLWSNSAPVTSISIVPQSGALAQYSSASLYGIKRGDDKVTKVLPVATGGTVTTSGGYTYHTFTSSGTLVVNKNVSVDALIVAGGGGGGQRAGSDPRAGGGGGAGGYLTSSTTLTAGSYAISVGSGGAVNGAGTSSSAFSISASGGGFGGQVEQVGGNGGSGGGSGEFTSSALFSTGIPGQGNNGGRAGIGYGYNGAGGGGAGAVGGNSNTPVNRGGMGGAGLQWLNGSYYAGGGGGGADFDGPSGAPDSGDGGIGGGGKGAKAGVAAVAGTINTGGGGGGSAGNGGPGPAAAGGGSGVVIVRYLTPA